MSRCVYCEGLWGWRGCQVLWLHMSREWTGRWSLRCHRAACSAMEQHLPWGQSSQCYYTCMWGHYCHLQENCQFACIQTEHSSETCQTLAGLAGLTGSAVVSLSDWEIEQFVIMPCLCPSPLHPMSPPHLDNSHTHTTGDQAVFIVQFVYE